MRAKPCAVAPKRAFFSVSSAAVKRICMAACSARAAVSLGLAGASSPLSPNWLSAARLARCARQRRQALCKATSKAMARMKTTRETRLSSGLALPMASSGPTIQMTSASAMKPSSASSQPLNSQASTFFMSRSWPQMPRARPPA